MFYHLYEILKSIILYLLKRNNLENFKVYSYGEVMDLKSNIILLNINVSEDSILSMTQNLWFELYLPYYLLYLNGDKVIEDIYFIKGKKYKESKIYLLEFFNDLINGEIHNFLEIKIFKKYITKGYIDENGEVYLEDRENLIKSYTVPDLISFVCEEPPLDIQEFYIKDNKLYFKNELGVKINIDKFYLYLKTDEIKFNITKKLENDNRLVLNDDLIFLVNKDLIKEKGDLKGQYLLFLFSEKKPYYLIYSSLLTNNIEISVRFDSFESVKRYGELIYKLIRYDLMRILEKDFNLVIEGITPSINEVGEMETQPLYEFQISFTLKYQLFKIKQKKANHLPIVSYLINTGIINEEEIKSDFTYILDDTIRIAKSLIPPPFRFLTGIDK